MKTKLLLFFIILFTVLPILSQRTYVPDDGFEQVLIDLGYDDVLDDYVANINISSILELNIQAKGILELTGIEGFVSLEKLNFRNNEIQKLDLTDNHELLYLDCSYNKIDELILTNKRRVPI